MKIELTEYEQQLLAAGFVTAESLDTEWQEYLTYPHSNRNLSYQSWRRYTDNLAILQKEYDEKIKPIYSNPFNKFTAEDGAIERRLMKQMGEIEQILGY